MSRGDIMAKQLNISFKENDTELELYNWVKSKLNPGTYIKELLYSDYLSEKNGILRTIPLQNYEKNIETTVALEETNVDTGEWDVD